MRQIRIDKSKFAHLHTQVITSLLKQFWSTIVKKQLMQEDKELRETMWKS